MCDSLFNTCRTWVDGGWFGSCGGRQPLFLVVFFFLLGEALNGVSVLFALIVSWIELFDSMEFDSDGDVKKLHWPCRPRHPHAVCLRERAIAVYICIQVLSRDHFMVCVIIDSRQSWVYFTPFFHSYFTEFHETKINGIKCPFPFLFITLMIVISYENIFSLFSHSFTRSHTHSLRAFFPETHSTNNRL